MQAGGGWPTELVPSRALITVAGHGPIGERHASALPAALEQIPKDLRVLTMGPERCSMHNAGYTQRGSRHGFQLR